MAKHPVPKRRSTKTRSDRRESTWATKTLKRLSCVNRSNPCPSCGQPCRPHSICLTCGQYRKRLVIDFAAKQKKKIQTIKAT